MRKRKLGTLTFGGQGETEGSSEKAEKEQPMSKWRTESGGPKAMWKFVPGRRGNLMRVDRGINMKMENVTPGFINVKQAIDLEKCKYEEMLIRVYSGEKRLSTGEVGDSR